MVDSTFDEFQAHVSEAVTEDELRSVYAGIVHESDQHEYYFGNDTEDVNELQEMAVMQLGMMVRVLAKRSDKRIDEVADLAVEQAKELQLQ